MKFTHRTDYYIYVSHTGDWFILDISTTLVLNQLLQKLAIHNTAFNTNIIGGLLEAWRKLSFDVVT